MKSPEASADGSATYLVECFAPGVTRGDVIAAAERARAASAGLRAAGTPVEYVGAMLMPVDEVVFHMFRSDGRDAVREACDLAALSFERVVDSILIDGFAEGAA